jgi:hypothetical protein
MRQSSQDYLAVEVGRFKLRATGRMAMAVVLFLGAVVILTGGVWSLW